MIRFGPAGNSDAFYEAGLKHTEQAPQWLADMGLSAFEYSFGRGVRLGQETGEKIALEAQRCDVQMSVHAPYFINLADAEPEKLQKNLGYFMDSAQAARYLGAQRIIFHPGSCAKMERATAVHNIQENLPFILRELREAHFSDFILCPETMGKINQIGDVEEICSFVRLDDAVYPTIDFGHLNARWQGTLVTEADYEDIIKVMIDRIGMQKTKHMHVHFSHIQYTAMGEKMHLTFEDAQWGPFFEPLAKVLARYQLEPVIICESKGTQALDALEMKRQYEAAQHG